ncbi:MAG: beta-galactosidase trimerization domain-containing protein [Verrucomicrobiia bacterium]
MREVIKQTRVVPQTAILVSFDSMEAQRHTPKRNAYFNQREHIHLFYAALHDRNIPVDFARPGDDLSRYRLVFAPSIHLLSQMEAEALKYYVQNGGTLVGTFDTGVVDEYNIATDSGVPLGLTDVFGLEVEESDMISNVEENHLAFKGAFTTTQLHTARVWCDIIRPNGCQILATYTKEFYAGKPALTLNHFGKGIAVYVATMCNQAFYFDLVAWLRQLCNLFPILKVPETIEVSLRQNENLKLYFLLNHQNSPVRLTFFKPVHDFLTGNTISGNYDLQPYDVLVVEQRAEV